MRLRHVVNNFGEDLISAETSIIPHPFCGDAGPQFWSNLPSYALPSLLQAFRCLQQPGLLLLWRSSRHPG